MTSSAKLFSPAQPTKNAQNDQGNTAMTSIAAPMSFDDYKKNAPKQGGYLGNYQRTGDTRQDYLNYTDQAGFDLYHGMRGNQGAYDRYNKQHGTNFGHPGAPSPSAIPNMSGYGGGNRATKTSNQMSSYRNQGTAPSGLSMAPDSTPEQQRKATEAWQKYITQNPTGYERPTQSGGSTAISPGIRAMPGSPTSYSPFVPRTGGSDEDYGITTPRYTRQDNSGKNIQDSGWQDWLVESNRIKRNAEVFSDPKNYEGMTVGDMERLGLLGANERVSTGPRQDYGGMPIYNVRSADDFNTNAGSAPNNYRDFAGGGQYFDPGLQQMPATSGGNQYGETIRTRGKFGTQVGFDNVNYDGSNEDFRFFGKPSEEVMQDDERQRYGKTAQELFAEANPGVDPSGNEFEKFRNLLPFTHGGVTNQNYLDPGAMPSWDSTLQSRRFLDLETTNPRQFEQLQKDMEADRIERQFQETGWRPQQYSPEVSEKMRNPDWENLSQWHKENVAMQEGRYAATQEQIDKAAGRFNRGGYFPDGSPKSDVMVDDPVTGKTVPSNYDRNNPGHQPGYQRPSDTPSGSKTIMPGETSEDPVAITNFSNSNVEGAPSSNDFEGIDFSMFQDAIDRVPGTEDMDMQDFYEKFNPRDRNTAGSAPAQGVPQTTTGPGYVTSQSFDQYLNPTTSIGYADDQANLGNMGNNLFDLRRPSPFEAQYVDPFGRTSMFNSLGSYADTVNREASFIGLLNSLKQQQGDALRRDGFGSYMPLDLQAIYDQAGTQQGQEQAASFNQGLFGPYYSY